jgi:hypothetical protein
MTELSIKIGGGREPIMPRRSRIIAALCLLAASGSLCVFATSSVVAKHKSSVVAKQKSVTPTPRTPVDKNDCVTLSQAFYGQAKTLSRQTKQIIPREFERVASNLDEFCGQEDFGKARISIDWMNTCLQNFTKDYKLGFCSRNKSYFCAIDPDGCLSQ